MNNFSFQDIGDWNLEKKKSILENLERQREFLWNQNRPYFN